jgi:hypothetical protein
MVKWKGAAAFPSVVYDDKTKVLAHDGGMTLRDWFAGQALTGLIPLIGIPEDGSDELWDADTAGRAYALADAMLTERTK